MQQLRIYALHSETDADHVQLHVCVRAAFLQHAASAIPHGPVLCAWNGAVWNAPCSNPCSGSWAVAFWVGRNSRLLQQPATLSVLQCVNLSCACADMW
jgi:hypothetical protein